MGAPTSVFVHTLHVRRRGLVFWTIGVGAYTAITLAFWPLMPEVTDLERLMEQMPEALMAVFGGGADDVFSPAGFVDSQLFAMVSPLLLLIVGIGGAAGTIAGEERSGKLELVLASPISRRRVVAEKAAGLAVLTAVLAAVHFLIIAIMDVIVGLGLALGNLLAMHLSLLLLAWSFGGLALALSAATGRRGATIGLAAAVAVAAYLLDTLAPLIDWIEPFRVLSPFYLYRGHQPLVHGLNFAHAGGLALLSMVLVAAAAWAYGRRDIGT